MHAESRASLISHETTNVSSIMASLVWPPLTLASAQRAIEFLRHRRVSRAGATLRQPLSYHGPPHAFFMRQVSGCFRLPLTMLAPSSPSCTPPLRVDFLLSDFAYAHGAFLAVISRFFGRLYAVVVTLLILAAYDVGVTPVNAFTHSTQHLVN